MSDLIQEFRDFVKEFQGESDRALVVLTAARLDFLLFSILQKYLIPNVAKMDDFFENQGPGASFSNKIILVYRLGLIDQNLACALNLVRKIRNDFAHETAACSLEKGSHKDRVRTLVAPYQKMPFYKKFKEAFIGKENLWRNSYMTIVGFLIIRLSFLFEEVESVSTENAWPLITQAMKDSKPQGVEEQKQR